MSRVEQSRLGVGAFPLFQASLAIGLLALGGCSADVARFDAPSFGLTDGGSRRASAPMPPEEVRPSPAGTGYGSYTPPAGEREQVAALNDPRWSPGPGQQAGYGYPQNGYPPNAYPQNGYPQNGYPQSGYGQGGYYPPPSQGAYPSQPAYRSSAETAPYPARPPVANAEPRPPATASEQPYRTVATRPVPLQTAPAASQPAPAAEPSPGAVASAGPGGTIEVQPGDTIYALATRHRVSISELMTVNGLSDPTLRPGQKLVLPSTRSKTLIAGRNPAPPAETASTPPPSGPARETGPMLASATPEAVPAAAPPAASEAGDTYTVKNGETLYGIAVRHKVPLAELQSLNGIAAPSKVMPGTVLKLPPSAVKAASASPAAAAGPAQPSSPPTIINAKPTQVAALENGPTASDAAPPAAAASRPEAIVPPLVQTPPALSQAKASVEPAGAAARQGESEDAGSGKLRWPVRGRIIAAFGPLPGGQHNDGIKLAVPLGTEVHAAEAGVVAYAGNELKGYGNLVLLRHDNGWITAYAHNDSLAVKRGDRVTRGQVIARAGKTGTVDQPQLHFELRQGSSPVDPIPYLERL